MSKPIVTYDRNPVVSEYTRRRNYHVALAERGIARSGGGITNAGCRYVWCVDEAGCYYESTVV